MYYAVYYYRGCVAQLAEEEVVVVLVGEANINSNAGDQRQSRLTEWAFFTRAVGERVKILELTEAE